MWISNEYLATLLTFVSVPIFFGVLIVSLIAEKIERSKITKDYFYLMAGLAIVPAMIFVLMYIINGGSSFDWAQ